MSFGWRVSVLGPERVVDEECCSEGVLEVGLEAVW